MNPPFSLLTPVCHRLNRYGGHVLVVCPEWAVAYEAFLRLSRRRVMLPRVHGLYVQFEKYPMPAPRFDSWVFYIHVWPPELKSLLTPSEYLHPETGRAQISLRSRPRRGGAPHFFHAGWSRTRGRLNLRPCQVGTRRGY